MEQTKGKLKLFDLISIGVGSVVGAGIFSMLMSGMAMTGRSIALALVGAMLITLLQQVRSIFMSSMFALDGGMYAQQALILPPVFTGMTAVVFVFSNFSFSVFGISIAQYLSQLIPALAPFQRILGVVILTAFFLVTIKGTGFLAKIQNVLAVCMYAALALFIVFGLIKGGTAEAAATPYFAGGPMGFLMAIAIMSFTCNGATNVINLSADTHNPKRNIPLGVLISAGICALIYFLLGYVASSVVPFAQAGSHPGLGGPADHAGGAVYLLCGRRRHLCAGHQPFGRDCRHQRAHCGRRRGRLAAQVLGKAHQDRLPLGGYAGDVPDRGGSRGAQFQPGHHRFLYPGARYDPERGDHLPVLQAAQKLSGFLGQM